MEKKITSTIVPILYTYSVADPQHLNAYPDPAFHFVADPDPTFHFEADPISRTGSMVQYLSFHLE